MFQPVAPKVQTNGERRAIYFNTLQTSSRARGFAFPLRAGPAARGEEENPGVSARLVV